MAQICLIVLMVLWDLDPPLPWYQKGKESNDQFYDTVDLILYTSDFKIDFYLYEADKRFISIVNNVLVQ